MKCTVLLNCTKRTGEENANTTDADDTHAYGVFQALFQGAVCKRGFCGVSAARPVCAYRTCVRVRNIGEVLPGYVGNRFAGVRRRLSGDGAIPFVPDTGKFVRVVGINSATRRKNAQ